MTVTIESKTYLPEEDVAGRFTELVTELEASSGLLRCQTLVLRRHRDSQTSTHRIHDLKKGLSHRGREGKRLALHRAGDGA